MKKSVKSTKRTKSHTHSAVARISHKQDRVTIRIITFSVLGLLLFLALAATIPIKGSFLHNLFQKHATHAAAGDPQPDGQGGSWDLIFSDEFNGTSIDTTKWAYPTDSDGLGGDLAHWDPAQVVESGGAVHFTAKTGSSTTLPYSSGAIWTQGIEALPAYGYWEMRARIPATKGTWPAFWSVAYDRLTDPNLSIWEIDTMEAIDHTITDGTEVSWNLHARNNSGGDNDFAAYHDPNNLGAALYQPNWHTYATNWTPTSLTWYVDGIAQFSITEGQVINGMTVHIPNMRQVLILQLAMQDKNISGESVDTTGLPATMDVDYVRVWQPSTGVTSTPTLTPTLTPSGIVTPIPSLSPTPTATPVPLPTNTPVPTATPPQSGTNFINNPSFEGTTSTWLSPWNFSKSGTATGSITQDAQTAASGTRSAKVTINRATSTAPWNLQLSQYPINLVAGRTYTISYAAKSSSSRTIQYVLQQGLSPYTVYQTVNTAITSSWHQYTYTFTPSVSNSTTSFSFNLAGATPTVWLDNVSIK